MGNLKKETLVYYAPSVLERFLRRKRNVVYLGSLAKPLDRPKSSLRGFTLADFRREQAAEERVIADKMSLLLDHYKIHRERDDKWFALARALAKDHVPGFKQKAAAGRPGTWGEIDYALAKICIDQFVAVHPAHSIKSAADHVVRQPFWKKRIRSKSGSEQIRQAYFRAKADVVDFILKNINELVYVGVSSEGPIAFREIIRDKN